MRPFATLAVAALSFSSLVAATPLDTQVILPGEEFLDDKRWSYTVCGMALLHSVSPPSHLLLQETPATSLKLSQLK